MHIAAPEELAEAVKEESKADRPHEKDDLLLIDKRTKHQPFDGDGEQHHDRSCDDKGAPDRQAAFDQPDEGQGGEQHHRALGEIEYPRGLVDQHEAECHERVHNPGEQAADDDLEHEFRIAPHVRERSDEYGLEEIHRRAAPHPPITDAMGPSLSPLAGRG
jgi:hypothetical protein